MGWRSGFDAVVYVIRGTALGVMVGLLAGLKALALVSAAVLGFFMVTGKDLGGLGVVIGAGLVVASLVGMVLGGIGGFVVSALRQEQRAPQIFPVLAGIFPAGVMVWAGPGSYPGMLLFSVPVLFTAWRGGRIYAAMAGDDQWRETYGGGWITVERIHWDG
ncbi:MAG: hypothetical protein AAGC53_06505 [Actinomycetota bacterium]